jgi:hypothetical protein
MIGGVADTHAKLCIFIGDPHLSEPAKTAFAAGAERKALADNGQTPKSGANMIMLCVWPMPEERSREDHSGGQRPRSA